MTTDCATSGSITGVRLSIGNIFRNFGSLFSALIILVTASLFFARMLIRTRTIDYLGSSCHTPSLVTARPLVK